MTQQHLLVYRTWQHGGQAFLSNPPLNFGTPESIKELKYLQRSDGLFVYVKFSAKKDVKSGFFDLTYQGQHYASDHLDLHQASSIWPTEAQFTQVTKQDSVAARNHLLMRTPLYDLVIQGQLSVLQVQPLVKSLGLLQASRPLEQRTVTPYWLYGPSGSGKTYRALKAYPGHYVKDSSHPYWDGYNGQTAVAIHEISPATFLEHKDLASKLKNWLDPHPQDSAYPVKGSYTRPRYQVIVVTSQYSPTDLWTYTKGLPRDLEAILRRLQDRVYFVEDNTQDIPGFGQGYLTN